MAHNPFKGKKRIISSVAIVVAILAALGAGMFMRSLQSDKTNDTGGAPISESQPPDISSTETKKVEELINGGKPDEAAAYVNQELAKSDINNQQKHDLYIAQGDIAYDKGDFNGAIASYQKADEANPTVRSARAVAEAAEESGNKQVAIEYYKKVIERLNKNSPVYNDDKANLENIIKYLGGTV